MALLLDREGRASPDRRNHLELLVSDEDSHRFDKRDQGLCSVCFFNVDDISVIVVGLEKGDSLRI
jgi:hypothetical protein